MRFSTFDKTIINQLAPQCPKAAGKGVFRARLLQNLYDDIVYDDFLICAPAPENGGKEVKKPDEFTYTVNGGDFKVFPNPSSNILTIETTSQLPIQWIMRDLTGKIILEESILQNAQIDVSLVQNGLYFCEFWQNSKCVNTQKIVIIH